MEVRIALGVHLRTHYLASLATEEGNAEAVIAGLDPHDERERVRMELDNLKATAFAKPSPPQMT